MKKHALNAQAFTRQIAEQLEMEVDDLRQRIARLTNSDRPADRMMAETYKRLLESRESLVRECRGNYRLDA